MLIYENEHENRGSIMKKFFILIISIFMFFCSTSSIKAETNCNAEAGFTIQKNNRCYKPNSLLSYQENEFYYDDEQCGIGCDYNGRNCTKGVCNVEDCITGYTQIKKGKCYNNKTFLSYYDENFYYKDYYCGRVCNSDGSNCNEGICNISDCANGYTEIREHWFTPSKYPIIIESPVMFGTFSHPSLLRPEQSRFSCYNPSLNLSYSRPINKKLVFAKDNETCGINCDYNGRNCEIGLCNAEDCPKGYKQYFHGACKSEKKDKVLIPVGVKEAKKFRDEKILTATNNAKYVAEAVIIPIEILILLPVSLFYP